MERTILEARAGSLYGIKGQYPVLFTPGTRFLYSNPGVAMLGYAVTSSLKNTSYDNIRDMLRDKIYSPIGIGDGEWKIGYGKIYHVDNLNLVAGWGGGSFTTNAIARIGRLMMRKGNWEGKQLIDSAWIERVIRYEQTAITDPDNNPELIPPATRRRRQSDAFSRSKPSTHRGQEW